MGEGHPHVPWEAAPSPSLQGPQIPRAPFSLPALMLRGGSDAPRRGLAPCHHPALACHQPPKIAIEVAAPAPANFRGIWQRKQVLSLSARPRAVTRRS